VLITAGAALDQDVPLAGHIVCGAVAVGIVAVMARARSTGIVVSSEGVQVRRYLGPTARVPWADVVRFELVPTSAFNSGAFVAVVTPRQRYRTQGLTVTEHDR
jgi:hypothetical protein